MKRLSCIIVIVVVLGVAGCGDSAPTPTAISAVTASPTASATPSPTNTAIPTFTPTYTPSPMPTATPFPTPSPTASPPPASEIAKSSVRIDVFVEEQGRSVLAGHGSGTILTARGQILTNAHVVCGADELVVALTSDADQPPTPTYYAEPITVNYVLDLALIQITTDLDGNEVAPGELDLPSVKIGSSNDVALGERIRIFGYPGTGAETLTLTEGTVSGFVSEDLGGGSERIWIKTDTDIDRGNSGGTAVNDRGFLVGIPTAGMASEVETLGYLRPSKLANYLGDEPCPHLVSEASIYEPNEDPSMAYGPLQSKTSYTAYLHENDLDFYTIDVQVLDLIEINLADIADDVDYDLALLERSADDFWVLDVSEGEDTSSEKIIYSPSTTGTYYVLVFPFEGYSLTEPYSLQAAYDGDVEGLGNVTIRGRLLDADTGRPIEGAVMFLLVPGVTGEQFIDSSSDEKLVQASSVTDAKGIFVLEQVPRGETYTGFIAIGAESLWQDDWLTIALGDPDDIELGDIQVSTD